MRAAYLYGIGDIRVQESPSPRIQEPTDAVVQVVRTCVCGSDLHDYRAFCGSSPQGMGHEFVGIVTAVGAAVRTVRPGDFVVSPFTYSCNTCVNCCNGVHSSCVRGGFFGADGGPAAQAESVRVPWADGTLVSVPGGIPEPEMLPHLLALSDVYSTGYHAVTQAAVQAGEDVVVIGDGAVGISTVLAAARRGAARIVIMGRHPERTELAREFGATHVVAERGPDGADRVIEELGGRPRAVIEAVGFRQAYDQAVAVVRPGGVISRVGLPQYTEAPVGYRSLFGPNVTLTGGLAPVRAYLPQLISEVLSGSLRPGRVFDAQLGLDSIGQAYRDMAERRALKVMVRP